MAGIIPAPVHAVPGAGAFALEPGLGIVADDSAAGALGLLQPLFARASGAELTLAPSEHADVQLIRTEPDTLCGPDGYDLRITDAQIVLRAAAAVGFLHGAQTLRQLLPTACETGGVLDAGARVPAIAIEDAPRFRWRGLHVDVARHMFPLDALKRLVETMALFKLNRLHWHLCDDQGWRLEIKAYPRLTEVGAWRAESPRRGARTQGDGTPYGGFYTQNEVRELVAFAAARGIEIVPEIEMPGHAQAAIAAYPELGYGTPPEVWTRWGISERIFNVKDKTMFFLDRVLQEVMDLFPSWHVHLGGDEAPTTEWEQSDAARERMRMHLLDNTRALQGWFISRATAMLIRNRRQPIAWDEALESGARPEVVVMAWRDAAHARTAAAAGHDVILCPMSCCYFDHYQGPPETEPEAIGGHTDLRKVLAFEPVDDAWSAAELERLLGIQGNLWSEYIHDAAHLEYMAWPRGAALAEVAWSPAAARDPEEFEARWAGLVPRLDALGVNHRKVTR